MSERPIHFSGPEVRALLEMRKTQTRHAAHTWRGHPIVFFGGASDRSDPRFYGFDDLETGTRWRLATDGREDEQVIPCPYGRPGDRLWVQESGIIGEVPFPEDASMPGVFRHDIPTTPAIGHDWIEQTRNFGTCYKVSGNPSARYLDGEGRTACPSIFMPRWASRIVLQISNIRLERLQAISEGDAIAEGIRLHDEHLGWMNECTLSDGTRQLSASACELYRDLWDETHATRGDGWDANPWVWVVAFKRVM